MKICFIISLNHATVKSEKERNAARICSVKYRFQKHLRAKQSRKTKAGLCIFGIISKKISIFYKLFSFILCYNKDNK